MVSYITSVTKKPVTVAYTLIDFRTIAGSSFVASGRIRTYVISRKRKGAKDVQDQARTPNGYVD